LRIREDIRRWQPSLRTLLLVQLTASQYRLQRSLRDLPDEALEANVTFEKDIARVMRVMSNEVSGKISEVAPDIQASATNLQREIHKYYDENNLKISAQATDVISLTEDIASILAPLYEDIHSTFASAQTKEDVGSLHQYRQREV
jgi:hypothetical protein